MQKPHYDVLMQRMQVAPDELNWDDVRLFLALCRAKTLSDAAHQLRVDASTISRRLTALERAMAAPLFDRGRDGISKTKAAEDLLPVAEEIEQSMSRFANAADGLEREISGLVRVTCPPDVAQIVLAPLLRTLLARHPALRVEIDPGESVLDLTRREADLALRTVKPTRGDLVVTKLTSMQWMAVASPKLVKEAGTLRAWTDVPWVGWGERLSSIGPARWLAAHLQGIDPVVVSDSLMVQLAAVSEGVGAALVPKPSVAHYGLVPLKLGTALREEAKTWPANDLFLVTHRALRDVPRVRVVWDLLVQRVGARPVPKRLATAVK